MKSHFRIWLVFSVLCWGVLSTRIEAQDVEGDRGFSIGGHFTGLLLDPLGEGAPGLGGRVAYDFPLKNSVILSPEVEVNHFPANPSGNFGETELLAGGKIGVRSGKTGIFAKLRPGVLHIPGNGDSASAMADRPIYSRSTPELSWNTGRDSTCVSGSIWATPWCISHRQSRPAWEHRDLLG